MIFERERDLLHGLEAATISGEITRVVGLVAESRGLTVPVGSQCEIMTRSGSALAAEVVGFREESAIVVPYGDIRGIASGDRIYYRGDVPRVRVGPHLIGKVLDSAGNPGTVPSLSGEGRIEYGLGNGSRAERGSFPDFPEASVPIHGTRLNPLQRQRIARPLPTGVRAIDGPFTTGRGQRLGIFSGAGVGKSVLLGMIARGADAPLSVIALIGERGREVREFLERDLGPAGLGRSIVVVATGDEPGLKRVQAALIATAIAEYFRERGEDVVFLLDSITRVAMAQREIGLSAGEPPATKGFPPSTFSLLSKLLERTGPGPRASITAFYTVLVEADDIHDPIGDAVRGILDGHLWLSRDLASKGFYPAIDPLGSVSRVMPDVVSEEHMKAAREMVAMVARYRGVEDLLQLGAYVPGGDVRVDEAVRAMPAIEAFLRQDAREKAPFEETLRRIGEAIRPPRRAAAGGAASAGPGGAGGAAASRAALAGLRAGTVGGPPSRSGGKGTR
jgi:flagellum-specific ATP synthase